MLIYALETKTVCPLMPPLSFCQMFPNASHGLMSLSFASIMALCKTHSLGLVTLVLWFSRKVGDEVL